MRVAYINPGTDLHGGAERSLIGLLEEIAAFGVEPYLLSFGDGSLVKWAEERNIPADSIDVALPGGGRFRGPVGRAIWSAQAGVLLTSRVRAVRAHLARFRPDIIHTNGSRAGILAPFLGATPLVMAVRDVAQSKTNRAALRFAARASAAVLTNSAFVADAYQFEKDRTWVIDNPVTAPPKRDREEARARLTLPSDAFVVANLSHLHWMKGHLDLIRASGLASDIVVVVAGGELYDQSSQSYKAQLHAEAHNSDRVRFLGTVDDVSWVYAAADVIAHCSVRPEGFGRTIVEGMLASRPVIASSAGAPGEYLVDGKTALLYEPGDVLALNRHLVLLRDDHQKRRELVETALDWAGTRFLPVAHARAVHSVYDTVRARA